MATGLCHTHRKSPELQLSSPNEGTTKARLVSFLKCRVRLLTVHQRSAFLAVDFSSLVQSLVRIVAVDDRMNRDTDS